MRDPHRERDHLVGIAIDVEPVDLAAVCCQHRLAVGRECVARNQVAGEPRFLLISLDGQLQPALFSADQVADAQAGLVVDARPVDQLAAVGRERRPKRTSMGIGDRVFITGRAIPTHHLRQRKIQVVIGVEELVSLGVEEVLPVFRGDRADSVRIVVPGRIGLGLALGDLHAGAAANVVHPELKGIPG